MTGWREERDRLVAQTLAFVQQVAAAHSSHPTSRARGSDPDDADANHGTIHALTSSIVVPETTEAELTVESMDAAIQTTTAAIAADLSRHHVIYSSNADRAEIAERVAAFKARQTSQHQAREAYYQATQARIRTALRNDSASDGL